MAKETTADITYLGRTFKTSITKPLTDEEYKEIVDYINQRPSKESAKDELVKVKNGGLKISNITGYYFLSLMYDARNGQDAWSINEALQNKQIMEYFNGKCAVNTKVFDPTSPLGGRILTAFRLCGIRCCRKVPQFPLRTINELLERYTVPGENYLDFSCGWGVRALSALVHNVNYFGTDPNEALVHKIYEMVEDYKDATGTYTGKVDIRGIGSEKFVPEWEGKMDFIFSSPPYFALEIYKSENQSYKEGMTYEDWMNGWMKPTIENIHKYLKDDGIFAINIKDIFYEKSWYTLENDTVDMIESLGFKLEHVHTLKNIKRSFGSVHWEKHTVGMNEKADEKIFVFKKI
ncbi:MAG: hypothetical protein IJH39_08275 [Clostridia bacterium]|nr:hypothetical protein [Clostridia bacterium]